MAGGLVQPLYCWKNCMNNQIMILTFLVFCSSVFVQSEDAKISINGRVISQINKKPVNDCLLRIKGTQYAEITDSLGRFTLSQLNQNSTYTISLLAFGYISYDTTVTITADFNQELNIILHSDFSPSFWL